MGSVCALLNFSGRSGHLPPAHLRLQFRRLCVMSSFLHSSKALQQEGVYIGSWSFRNVFTLKRLGRAHDSGEDRVQANAVAEQDWTVEEERTLVRKLDLRVLFPCCIVYFLAYLAKSPGPVLPFPSDIRIRSSEPRKMSEFYKKALLTASKKILICMEQSSIGQYRSRTFRSPRF